MSVKKLRPDITAMVDWALKICLSKAYSPANRTASPQGFHRGEKAVLNFFLEGYSTELN